MVPWPKIFRPIRSRVRSPIKGIFSSSAPSLAMPNFIVSFKNDISDDDMNKAINDLKASGGVIKDDYRPLLKAVAAEIPQSYMATLKSDDLIKDIEPDGVVTTQDTLL